MTNNPNNTGLAGRVIMRSLGLPGWPSDGSEGQWLAKYDPDGGQDVHPGRGLIVWTPTKEHALVFETLAAAMTLWREVNPAHPVRPDGRPNRPLSAYTVTFDPAPEPAR